MKMTTLLTLGLIAMPNAIFGADYADLVRLYEEEILAHDLYVALAEHHPDVMPLRNIPRSEKMHREALAAVLKADGIELPKPADGRRFVSAGLDEAFTAWLAEGIKSEADACRVGVRLEDYDIADLRKAQTNFPAHKEVFAQLEDASNNHLRAFHRNLTARNGRYAPEAISAASFAAILKGSNSCGQGACRSGCGNEKGKANSKSNGGGRNR